MSIGNYPWKMLNKTRDVHVIKSAHVDYITIAKKIRLVSFAIITLKPVISYALLS